MGCLKQRKKKNVALVCCVVARNKKNVWCAVQKYFLIKEGLFKILCGKLKNWEVIFVSALCCDLCCDAIAEKESFSSFMLVVLSTLSLSF